MDIFWVVLGLLMIASGVMTLVASFVIVQTGSIAIVLRWGKFYRVIEPGIDFIIPFVDKVEIHSTATHQFELPDEPENIDRSDKEVQPGMKLPYRITHKGLEEANFYVRADYNGEKGVFPFDNTAELHELKLVHFSELHTDVQVALQADSLNAPLTAEWPLTFEWHLKADKRDDWRSIHDFIQNVGPEDGRSREEEVRKRADDAVSHALLSYLGPTTLGHAFYMTKLFSKLIKEKLEEMVGEKPCESGDREKRPWGIQIDTAFLKPPNPGHTINTARALAGAAVSEKFKTIRDAEAAAESKRLDAAAEGDATRIKARADRFKEIKKGEGEAGRIAAMSAVMEGNDNARFIAELDVRERCAEAYEKNTTVTTYAPGTDSMLPLPK